MKPHPNYVLKETSQGKAALQSQGASLSSEAEAGTTEGTLGSSAGEQRSGLAWVLLRNWTERGGSVHSRKARGPLSRVQAGDALSTREPKLRTPKLRTPSLGL